MVHAITGFTNRSLRGLVAGLLGNDYTISQMTYDLRRLRLHGLIEHLPHTNTYITTAEGLRVALFNTKVRGRILRPLLDGADRPPGTARTPSRPDDPRSQIADYVANARIGRAA